MISIFTASLFGRIISISIEFFFGISEDEYSVIGEAAFFITILLVFIGTIYIFYIIDKDIDDEDIAAYDNEDNIEISDLHNDTDNSRDVVSTVIGSVKSYGEAVYSRIEAKDAVYLAKAEEEVNNGEINEAMWSQALVKAKGNESQRKIEYMKLRARQLKRS